MAKSDRRPRSWLWAGVAAAGGLIVGLLVGGGTAALAPGGWAGDASSSAPQIAAGPVEEGPTETPKFTLRVFNPGEHDLTVTLLGVAGWAPRRSTTASIEARSWGLVEFSAPVDCSSPLTDARTVQLRVRAGSDVLEQELPLPARAETLVEYHQAVCAAPTPITADELAGVWLVEEVYGAYKSGEGVHMMRFNRDGTFAMDPQGELFGGRQAVRGSFRLDGAVLTTTVEGGWACEADLGGSASWLASLPADGRLHLALQRDSRCPDGDGDVWIARRVLLDVGLPASPPGVAPASD